MAVPHVTLNMGRAAELSLETLYGILRLRAEVLVVEPQSAYLDLDGKDLAETTVHVWAASDSDIVGYVRIVDEGSVGRIGRLCTAHHARGRGVARKMLTRAIEACGHRSLVTSVQSHLAPWYETMGFVATGPMYHEVGIPHTPMRLDPTREV